MGSRRSFIKKLGLSVAAIPLGGSVVKASMDITNADNNPNEVMSSAHGRLVK
jgi:hypothetical protein